MSRYTVTSAPANEVWTSSDQEVLDHMKLVSPSDTDLIDLYLKAARQWVENYTGRALITQTIKEFFDYWPYNVEESFALRFSPIQSVTSIKYYDDDNSLQTWDSSNYYVDSTTERPVIELGVDKDFPDVEERRNAIEVIYVAGYGDDATDVPELIRHSVLLLATEMYENRENPIRKMPTYVEYLLNPYRVWEF